MPLALRPNPELPYKLGKKWDLAVLPVWVGGTVGESPSSKTEVEENVPSTSSSWERNAYQLPAIDHL